MSFLGKRKFLFKNNDLGIEFEAFQVAEEGLYPEWFWEQCNLGRATSEFQVEVWPGEWRLAVSGDWIVYDPFNGDIWISADHWFQNDYAEVGS
jgi:hypothetical protein